MSSLNEEYSNNILNDLRRVSKEGIKLFVDAIGLDGDFYSNLCHPEYDWVNPATYGIYFSGKYIRPDEIPYDEINWSNERKDSAKQNGLIFINKEFKNEEPDEDLFVTVIHETLHANRNLLLNTTSRKKSNPLSYDVVNSHYVQNLKKSSTIYADASQDILKGSFDTSKKGIEENIKNQKKIKNNKHQYDEKDKKMEEQKIVDESLIELMSILSYQAYSNKQHNKSFDIWRKLGEAKEIYNDPDFPRDQGISLMCDIILKHHDFELFNWMLDPISYSHGDPNYDFFADYTKNDSEITDVLLNLDFSEEDEHENDIYITDDFDVIPLNKNIEKKDKSEFYSEASQLEKDFLKESILKSQTTTNYTKSLINDLFSKSDSKKFKDALEKEKNSSENLDIKKVNSNSHDDGPEGK